MDESCYEDAEDTNIDDEGSSEMNDGLDKNEDAEEDFEFCYNCHSWEHNTLNCTINISKKGDVKNVQVSSEEQGQSTKNHLPMFNNSTKMPNPNTSKTQKASDKVRPKVFPISIKLLKDKKNAATKEESESSVLEISTINDNSNLTNTLEEISPVEDSSFTSSCGLDIRNIKEGMSNSCSTDMVTIPGLNILTPPEEKPSQERSASPLSIASQSSSNQRSYSPRWRKSQDPSSKGKNNTKTSMKSNTFHETESIDIASSSKSQFISQKPRVAPYLREKDFPSSRRSRSSSRSRSPRSVSPDHERSLMRSRHNSNSKAFITNSPSTSKSPNRYRSSRRSKSPRCSVSRKHSSSPEDNSAALKYSRSPNGSERSPRSSKWSNSQKRSNHLTDSKCRSPSSSSKLQKSIQKELDISINDEPNVDRGNWSSIDPVVRNIHRSPGGSRYKSPSPLRKPHFRSRSSSLSPSPPPPLVREKRRDSVVESGSSARQDRQKRRSWSPSSESDQASRYSRYPFSPPGNSKDHRRRKSMSKANFSSNSNRSSCTKRSSSRRNSRDSERRSRDSYDNSPSYSRSPSNKRSQSPMRQLSHEEFLENLVSIGQGKPAFPIPTSENLHSQIDPKQFLTALSNPITRNINSLGLQNPSQQAGSLMSPTLGLPMGMSLNQPPPTSNTYNDPSDSSLPHAAKTSIAPHVNLLLPFMGPPVAYQSIPPPPTVNLLQNFALSNEMSEKRHKDGNEMIKSHEHPSNRASKTDHGVDITKVISSWVKIDGLHITIRREDVINHLALLGFTIGKAYTTNGIVLEPPDDNCSRTTVKIKFNTKATAICFMKKSNEKFLSKEQNVSYLSIASSIPASDYKFFGATGRTMFGLVCCIGIKVGIYPVNEYNYQIRPEIISCTIRDETFIIKFETENFIQKNQKEKDFRKFIEEFEALVSPKLEKNEVNHGFDKVIFIFESAKTSKMFWLWLHQFQDFNRVTNIVECYGFGDRISTNIKKDICFLSQLDCNEIEMQNPVHKSCTLDDLLHSNVSKNSSYLDRLIEKDFKFTRSLKSSLQQLWHTNSNEIVVVFVVLKFVMVNQQPYLTQIQLYSPRTSEDVKFIYIQPSTMSRRDLEDVLGYKMDDDNKQWIYSSKSSLDTQKVISEKEALTLMIKYLSDQKSETNGSIILFSHSSYVSVPLLLIAFERHFDILGDFLSTICGVSDLSSLTKEFKSEIYDLDGHDHIISPSLDTLHPAINQDDKRDEMIEVWHLYHATKNICRERSSLDSFLTKRAVSFEHIHLYEVQGVSEEIVSQSTISIKPKSYRKIEFNLREVMNIGQPLVSLTKRYEDLGLEISEFKLLGSLIELTIQNNSKNSVVVNKQYPIGRIIPNPYNVKWPSNLKWLPDCIPVDSKLYNNDSQSVNKSVFESTIPISLRKISRDESNMLLPTSTTLFVLGRQKERKVINTSQNISEAIENQGKIKAYFISIKIETIKGDEQVVKEICLVTDKGDTAFHSTSEHSILKEFQDFLSKQVNLNMIIIGYNIYVMFKTLEQILRQKHVEYQQTLNKCVKYLCDVEWCLKGAYISKNERGLATVASKVLQKDMKDSPNDALTVCLLLYDILRIDIRVPFSSVGFVKKYCLDKNHVERLYKSSGTNSSSQRPLILIHIDEATSRADVIDEESLVGSNQNEENKETSYSSDMSIDPEDHCIDLEESKFIEDTIEREVKNYKPKERKTSFENTEVNDKERSIEDATINRPEQDRTWTSGVKQKDPRLRKTMEKKALQSVVPSPAVKPTTLGCLPPIEFEKLGRSIPSSCQQIKPIINNVLRDKDDIAVIYATFLKSCQKQYLTSLYVFFPNLGSQVFKVDSITPSFNWTGSVLGKYYRKIPHAPEGKKWILKECTARDPEQKTEAETVESLKNFLENLELRNPAMRLNITVLVPSHVHYLENVLGRYDMKFESHFKSVSKWCDLTTFVYNNFTDNSMHWKAPDENLGKLEELYFHVFNRHPDPRQTFKPKLMYEIYWKLTNEGINFPLFYKNSTHIFKLDEAKRYLYINIHLGIELIKGEETISTIGLYNALNKQGNISEFPQKILIPLLPKPRHEDKWERLSGFTKLGEGRWGYRDGDNTKMVKCKSERDAFTTIAKIMTQDCINWNYDGIVLIFLDHKGFPHFLNATILHGLERQMLEKLVGVGDVATITQCLDDDCPMSSKGRLPSLQDLEANYHSLLKQKGEESSFVPFCESNSQMLARAACMLFFSMKNQNCTDKKSQISLHHIASPLRSPYVNMLLYKSEIPIFREGFGSVLISKDLRLQPSMNNQPVKVKCIITGIIYGKKELEFVIDKEPESLVEAVEEKISRLGKNSVFEISVSYNVRKELSLQAGTKIGVAKTGSLAILTHVSKKKKGLITSVSSEGQSESPVIPVDTESESPADGDSDSDLRDQILENKNTSSRLPSPRTEKDMNVALNEASDSTDQETKSGNHLDNVSGNTSYPKDGKILEVVDQNQSKEEDVDNESIKTKLEESNKLGGILFEKTGFLTKSCYPNLKPLYEKYCIHCVKTDKDLNDKDVIGVADDIMPCLAAYGIEDMTELDIIVADKDGEENNKEVARQVLLEKHAGLENLLEENILELLIDLIYDYHRSNPDNIRKKHQKENTQLSETTSIKNTSSEKEVEAIKPKESSRKSGPATDPRQGAAKYRRKSVDNISKTSSQKVIPGLKDILNLDGSTKQVSIGKITDLDSIYCSVQVPTQGIFEVSRESILSYSSDELSNSSYLIVRVSNDGERCEQAVELSTWKTMSDCYYGFVEEQVGKNMVTVAFIDGMNTISLALAPKKSVLFMADGSSDKDSFGLGTRVAICVEKNHPEESTKQYKALDYKGVLLLKQTLIEKDHETYQLLIRRKYTEGELMKFKEFLPSDTSFQLMHLAKTTELENQTDVLLITSDSRKNFVLCKTLLEAEYQLIKDIPTELRRNIDTQNQIFSAIVNRHPGVCLRLSLSEDKILIACSSTVGESVNSYFDSEMKSYVETQCKYKEGYVSSDSLEYEPVEDDDEILLKKVEVEINVSQKPINTVAENVSKMLAEKISERKRRMETEEEERRVSKERKPNMFESYFGKFKSMPKNKTQDKEITKSNNDTSSITNNNDKESETNIERNNYHGGDVSNFLRSMREESDLSRNKPLDYPIRRPPSPPTIRDRSRSPLRFPSDKTSSDVSQDCEKAKNQPESRRRCFHFPHPDKLCHDFFVLGKCANKTMCRYAHHILEPIHINYCHKYIDQARKRECSGTFETKCGKAHIGFWKLNREYQREVRDLQLNCKQCDNIDQKGGEGSWSDVSSVEESRRERSSNRSLSREKSPNRFLVKNEIMKGNLASKSTQCVNCPISDELCVTFVGLKCQYFPKCFKAHKIPNRLKIRYCSDFINPNVFCKGNCGDPHIKFDRLKSIYKEETQMMYKSCSICSNEKSSRRSLSPEAPSEGSSQSNRSNLLGSSRNRSPLPHLPNRRIVTYEKSDSEEQYDNESNFTETSSQRSASPHSSSFKDRNSLPRRNNLRIGKSSVPCKYYQKGNCNKGKDCFFSHIGSKNRR